MKRHINKAKRVSRQCRNNNWCPYCRRSRLHSANKRISQSKQEVKEFSE